MEGYSKFIQNGKQIIAIAKNYNKEVTNLQQFKIFEQLKYFRDRIIPFEPTKPMIFLKPTSSLITEGQQIRAPKGCKLLESEVELGVIIGKTGSNIPDSQAMDYVAGYVLALDMTARDILNEAKRKGAPWTFGKGFNTSTPVSSFIEKSKIINPHNVNLWCKVNGQIKQEGNTKDMIFKVPFLISYISSYFTLQTCDLILTGTPSLGAPVKPGDKIECGIDKLISMSFTVA